MALICCHTFCLFISSLFLWLSLYPPNDHAHDENENTTSFAAVTADDSNNKEEAFFILSLLQWRNCCYFVCPCGAWLLLFCFLLLIICSVHVFHLLHSTMFLWRHMNVYEKMRVIKTTLDKGYARNWQKIHYHVKKYFQGNQDDAITQNVFVYSIFQTIR